METHYWNNITETYSLEDYILNLHKIGYTILFVIPISYEKGVLKFCSIITTKQFQK